MKRSELGDRRVAKTVLPRVDHLNRQIPPEPHTAMYVWHKYWSRKTWNVVGEFIAHYTRPGDIVFDPFAGSGVTAIEALRHGRRAIICDLNPIAGFITDLTLRPMNPVRLLEAFEGVRARAQRRIERLYEIHCLHCGAPLTAAAFVREGDVLTEVRYPNCPACEHRCASGGRPDPRDVEALIALEQRRVTDWHPRQRLYYGDGTPFMKKERYETLDQLFTRRNLMAAAMLYAAIQQESSPAARKFLMGAFTSMIHLCTRMMPVCDPAPTNHATPFSSPGWTQHSYWSAPRYMEQPVWTKFESAVAGHQGLVKAKEESQRAIKAPKLADDWRAVVAGNADVAILTADSLQMMDRMPDACVDYIFTDPPYDSSVQYGELSLLWNAWLAGPAGDARYADRIQAHELVRNEKQGKSFDVYHALLSTAFQKCHRVLKSGRYLTLTFHNPTFKVRNATVRAGVFAGFDYQKIHHQPLARTSPKALLQPFGSADGDFYLRFEKPEVPVSRGMDEITEERFRRIVIETCREVIAERAEPTPYTILINYIDPVLARMGLFGTLNTGLDIKKVLEESLGRDFVLIKTRMGGASGDLWWFQDPTFIARLREVPLTERVEQTVFRSLKRAGRVTFTQVWDDVSREFPNSLTSDSTSIKEALETYGRKVAGGYWMLRDEVRARLGSHAELIALLALVGRRQGHAIWVGRHEQSDRAGGLAPDVLLSSLVTCRPTKLVSVSNLAAVLDMDLLWLNGDRVVRAFEIEATTTMTGGLLRGSNLPADTPKTMVLPEEREGDFQRKLQSPLFRKHFEEEGWSRLYFDSVRQAYSKHGDRLDLATLKDVRAAEKQRATYGRAGGGRQCLMFFESDAGTGSAGQAPSSAGPSTDPKA